MTIADARDVSSFILTFHFTTAATVADVTGKARPMHV